jgi:hypothetical protein
MTPSTPATPPQTYAEWSAWLDRLAEATQDEACLEAMQRGVLVWSGGVATQFSKRLAEEFNRRLTRCSQHLTRDLRISNDESRIVQAILNARKMLAFLQRLAQASCLPEVLRVNLTDEVRKFAVRSQESLEDSARTDRTGRLRVLLKNNSLLGYEAQSLPATGSFAAPAPAAIAPSAPSTPAGAPRRRIILT